MRRPSSWSKAPWLGADNSRGCILCVPPLRRPFWGRPRAVAGSGVAQRRCGSSITGLPTKTVGPVLGSERLQPPLQPHPSLVGGLPEEDTVEELAGERELPPAEHPSELGATLPLAHSAFQEAEALAGEFEIEAALPKLQLSISRFQRCYGKDHPALVEPYGRLSLFQMFVGELEAAESVQERVLHIMESFYGPKHIRTAMVAHELAVIKETLRKEEEADRLHRCALELLDRAERVVGLAQRRKITDKVKKSLTRVVVDEEQRKQLEEEQKALIEWRYHTEGLGALRLKASAEYATFLDNHGRHRESLPYHSFVFQKDPVLRLYDHPFTHCSLHVGLAQRSRLEDFSRLDVKKGSHLYHKLEDLRRESLQRYQELQQETEELSDMHKVIDLMSSKLGKGHNALLKPLYNLCWLLIEKGDVKKVNPYLKQLFEIEYRTKGPESAAVARVLNLQALACCRVKEWEEAHRLLERSKELKAQTMGPVHIHVALICYDLAQVYFMQQQAENCLEELQTCHDIFCSELSLAERIQHPWFHEVDTLFQFLKQSYDKAVNKAPTAAVQ
ncbi:hypothetical protein QOT17_015151 [Balamuthia mandrillaris]